MKALTVQPGVKNSVRLEDVADVRPGAGEALVETIAIGICATDRDIIAGRYGKSPPGSDRLVIGHESLGRVLEAPQSTGLTPGDLVVGIVRRPDPVPCANCAVGEWDMCVNGLYTEHGIKELDGFCRERFALDSKHLVRLDSSLEDVGVLVEPASVVAKAWDEIERIGRRAHWEPRRALVTGAGPVGLLAGLMAVERGLETHILDRATDGPKPGLVRDLGAVYHVGDVRAASSHADVLVECTGAGELFPQALETMRPNGIVCLTGLSTGTHTVCINIGALSRDMILENHVVFGSVNANRRHYEMAVKSLAGADRDWLGRIIARRESPDAWERAIVRQSGDVKTVLDFRMAR
ncbi:MAG TPA: glucose 1-dehydrogenase [Terriglobia bacterium]|nr:glucose 1-dehydrogenase [Terriglobia bacterium]